MKSALFHYTSCGLRNIWLRNGYTRKDTAYGEAVAIHDLDGLHRVIGLYLVDHKPRLSSTEVRFLRIELDMSQKHLAQVLGVSEVTLRGWEKYRTKITKPADRLLRVLYREHVDGDGTVRDLVEQLGDSNRDAHTMKNIELEDAEQGWTAKAA